MSYYNTANEVAYELVYGRSYHTEEAVRKPVKVVLAHGDERWEIPSPTGPQQQEWTSENHKQWGDIAQELHAMFADGWYCCDLCY